MRLSRRKLLAAALLAASAACSPQEEPRGGRVPGEVISSSATAAALAQEDALPAETSLITEMRRRLVVPADSSRWTPDQYTALMRCREAEKMGAFAYLRQKLGSLRGLAVEFRAGNGYKGLDLTTVGYRKFVFVLSQEAFQYFESKGAEGQWVYKIRTVDGKRIFTDDGMLTHEGVTVYLKVRRRIPAFWKFPNGRIVGTTRPPKDLLARLSAPRAFEPVPSQKPLPRPKAWSQPQAPTPEGGAVDQSAKMKALLDSGYVEITEAEERRILEATRLSERQLQDKSSLEILTIDGSAKYLISPSDPLMGVVSQYRATAPRSQPDAAPAPKPKLQPTAGVQ
ncbi:MAG: hypothetical protein AUJ52_15245 [Elusimicrobia bacterium CG1_02_63_36]|nr:MAG: hypothetical protein AUJ52_15245 [Elusimicrobia bacterium CG1_02_63_36]PIP84993.1 MAG: hypothetical protein COR54_01375 [Elusimicrobia bacterium CG22_combo_CG10-13_8_21_14_all_63_91]PJA12411.1 MAG: hypothetical protein COX66_17660 [Elusimicrobia bacterium CG_4_10_14_0_2_um_filter_63_34]PJB26190.1 MAG: hypothetical protein CO113_05080 [Elusimicrobia bacterium CG_4_9_14_3_um_filter_62_55]